MELDKYFITVLFPVLETKDANLDYYYEFDSSIAEYKKAFEVLKLQWQWQPVTIKDYKKVITKIAANGKQNLVVNLCDGDEVNGTPGISVIQFLKKKKLKFTGSDEDFYFLTTSKITMKKAFDEAKISTAGWKSIFNGQSVKGYCKGLQTPLIVKPAVSGGSIGLGVRNVVSDDTALKNVVNEIHKGYHGWDLSFGGIVAEEFINGPEFTVFIIGSHESKKDAVIYPPVERCFHESLSDNEKFLSFDRLWEIYEKESAMLKEEDFFKYQLPKKTLWKEICNLSWDAYCSVKGNGYGRVDIRMDKNSGKMYVLEVNAQCGISEDENYTSIGAILRLHNATFPDLLKNILIHGLTRKDNQNAAVI